MYKINKFRVNFIDKYLIIFIAIVLLGGFLRFYRLGSLPIDGDNSYHAIAAKAILESGLPVMPSGELYMRSLPLMYVEAFSIKIFGFNEWSLSFPNALIGTINILFVYILVMKICKEKSVSIITALLFSLSPWATITARMPRMYETFLMAVLITWIFYYNWYFIKERLLNISLILASVTTIFLHQAAIIPLCCFTIPILLRRKFTKKNLASAIYFTFLFTLWIFQKRILLFIFK